MPIGMKNLMNYYAYVYYIFKYYILIAKYNTS